MIEWLPKSVCVTLMCATYYRSNINTNVWINSQTFKISTLLIIIFHALIQLPSQLKTSSFQLFWKPILGKNLFERFYLIVYEINIYTNAGFDFLESFEPINIAIKPVFWTKFCYTRIIFTSNNSSTISISSSRNTPKFLVDKRCSHKCVFFPYSCETSIKIF